MINSLVYDVEVLPNFFSITIVNLNDYLKVFDNACSINSKGKKKPIPLVQVYSVKEIKQKLDSIDYKGFYITDTDDSQLFPMIEYIQNMTPHRDDKGIAVRTDMFGYNNNNYDKLMVAGLLMYVTNTKNTKELITKLYELSKHIIELQDNKEIARHDYMLTTARQFKLPYIDVDTMTIFALNKVGTGTDKDGNKVYFPKGLKQTSINLNIAPLSTF